MSTESKHPIVRLLGERRGSPRCKSALERLGEVSETRFDALHTVHVTAASRGLDLKFQAAAGHASQPEPSTADGMVLVAAFFYPDGTDEYQGSTELPYDLKFDQSRVAVRQLLGLPSASSSHYKNDRWELGPLYLTLDFSDDESRIQQVCVGLIEKDAR